MLQDSAVLVGNIVTYGRAGVARECEGRLVGR